MTREPRRVKLKAREVRCDISARGLRARPVPIAPARRAQAPSMCPRHTHTRNIAPPLAKHYVLWTLSGSDCALGLEDSTPWEELSDQFDRFQVRQKLIENYVNENDMREVNHVMIRVEGETLLSHSGISGR